MEEVQAGDAVAALMGQLAPEAKVLRDGEMVNLPADQIVPGDIIRIRLGDVIPADLKLLEGDPIKVDQSSLTGESLPVTKGEGDEGYSGSVARPSNSLSHPKHCVQHCGSGAQSCGTETHADQSLSDCTRSTLPGSRAPHSPRYGIDSTSLHA